ncbi:peptidoglycan-binding protein LysM [Humitalea sp. 24SJ18S-53]|uniref:peptidoglycan-binding protein LysM n=1 Tax=Humitalea sp. 24SJ18S-53 TaxID=3422307 RepID=UPI003D674BBA
MGLFSFVAAAGRLLGIGGSEATQDASRPPPAPPTAEAVQAELTRLGVAPADVTVRVEGDRVHLGGTAPDAETRERMILAAGNVAGIAAVEEAVTTATPAPAPVFHTVVRGDTLSKIAQQHLGNANKYPAIFEANKPMLTHPDKIYPGQVLRIPPQA